MTNPYDPYSDPDSMAGLPMNPWGGVINPQKFALVQRPPQQARPMPMRGQPIGQPRPYHPIWDGVLKAEAFEAARGNQAIIGMDSGPVLIAAGATFNATTGPQKPCILTRMIVSTATAGNFILLSLTVGTESCLLTNGVALTMAAFEPQSTAPEFRSVLARVGNVITAQVTNVSANPQRFTAALYAVPWVGFDIG